MIVVSVVKAPNRLRGFLSQLLLELNTGLYVGNVSATVRMELWKHIQNEIGSGSAVLLWNTNTEQGFDFVCYQTDQIPKDFDGLKLLFHSLEQQKVSKIGHEWQSAYVACDIETTGLSLLTDQVLEIGLARIENHVVMDQQSWLLASVKDVPETITKMTGITSEMIRKQGKPVRNVLMEVFQWLDHCFVIGYNIRKFDWQFLQLLWQKEHLQIPRCKLIDVMELAKQCLSLSSYQSLHEVRKLLKLNEIIEAHRALSDAIAVTDVYETLHNKFG